MTFSIGTVVMSCVFALWLSAVASMILKSSYLFRTNRQIAVWSVLSIVGLVFYGYSLYDHFANGQLHSVAALIVAVATSAGLSLTYRKLEDSKRI